MKKIIFTILSICLLVASQAQDSGKAFEKGNMYHSLGIGGQYYWVFAKGWGSSLGRGFTLQYQGEWGIHDYVGLGLHAGITQTITNYYYSGGYQLYVPVGLQANFHFYQLIDDKVSSNIHSDKLDIYAGLNVGGGPMIDLYRKNSNIYGAMHVGSQVGVRYYPKKNFGIFAEVGYGKSFGQFGIVIK